MEKSIVVHRLSLDMNSQAVQATITLAQYDKATHRLIVTLRHGADPVELPPGSYAIAVQNADAGVDVMDSVTVYGADSTMPNCIVYDVTAAVTEKEGYHEAQFLISCVDESGSLRSLSSPRIAFVVKPDILRSSDVQNSSPYAAVVAAQAAAETAKDKAEAAQRAAEAVGVVSDVSLTEDDGLLFKFADGREFKTESVKGPQGESVVGPPGKDGVSPTVDVAAAEGGYHITVTDKNGANTFFLPNGEKGEPGDFRIEKTYESVAEMEAAFATDGVPQGGFVLIATGSVEDADNAKLFVKGENAYQYLIDLSGATGIKGEPGSSISSITKTGSAGLVDTYTVTLTDGSTATFTVTNGKDGADGEDGSGEILKNTVLCDVDIGSIIAYDDWEDYRVVGRATLADKILPNTTYLINGTPCTSDGNGVVQTTVTIPYHSIVDITLSGRNLETSLSHGMSDSYRGDVEYVRVTVIGPGAMGLVAQHPLIYLPMNDTYRRYEIPLAQSIAPYALVYIQNGFDNVVRTVMADENGEVGEVQLAAWNDGVPNVYASIADGVLYVRCDWTNIDYEAELGSITVTTDVINTVGGSGGSSAASPAASAGGETHVYYISNYASSSIGLDPSKIYRIVIFNGNGEQQIVWEKGIVRETVGYMSDFYVDESQIFFSDVYNSTLVIVQEITSYTEVTCFMPGTRILLRDPVTMELYEKNVEDVLPFEYAAYWHPGKGRLTATRIVAPPIVGECTEYDRLSFSDGTTVDVYGVQFFWNVDTDRLQNWASMKPGARVCTAAGDIIEYVGHEHIVSDLPVKHYTLLPFMGRYIANGIQVGDKRELILPRLLQPENKRYWRMLPERDQSNLKRAFGSGMKRRNWRYSKEAMEVRQRYRAERTALEDEQKTAQGYLDGTDYQVIKLSEGVLSEAEFAPVREGRAAARDEVNRCREALAALQPAEDAEIEAVRVAIMDTYQPKFEGKFKDKTRCILEEE